MRCKICNGQLYCKDGFYWCENCNRQYNLSSVYENIEVFIAYIENDEPGRRTRDSIIAQDLFHKLTNAGISVFYQRISAEDLTEKDFDVACKTCASQSKILMFVGTNKENFDKLMLDYHDLLSDKSIIPVYADMNADDLPTELNKIQSLNYNNVGSVSDMISRILQILGRNEEIVFTEAVHKHKNKKRKMLCILLISVLLIVIGISACIVFGTTLVLPEKKYEAAQTLIQNEKYADAISVLFSIIDYKDSSDLMRSVYDRYGGYYQSDDNNIGMHLSISDNSVISVEINEKDMDNSLIKITENAEIAKNIAAISFNDSLNQQGIIMIELTNYGINLNIRREHAESKSVFFQLNEKSDEPILEQITAETIKDWLLNGITESDLRAKGYELEFEQPIERDEKIAVYKIKNTDIKLALYPLHSDETEHLSGVKHLFKNKPDGDRAVMGVGAPAELLTPQKIGTRDLSFIDKNILYVPNGDYFHFLYFYFPDSNSEINSDTIISCTSKILQQESSWTLMIREVYTQHIKRVAAAEYGIDLTEYDISLEAENETEYLYSCVTERGQTAAMYKISKNNYKVTFITELSVYKQPDRSGYGYTTLVNWEAYPELFDEFIGYGVR